MNVIKKVKFTEGEMDAVQTVHDMADVFTDRFADYTMLDAVELFFEALTRNTNEVEV